MNKIMLENGKYTFIEEFQGSFVCERYGEEWRDFTGDKAVYALFDALLESREQILKLKEQLDILKQTTWYTE